MITGFLYVWMSSSLAVLGPTAPCGHQVLVLAWVPTKGGGIVIPLTKPVHL